MKNEKKAANFNDIFKHPFIIVLAVIVIFYGGYLFGQWLYFRVN